MKTFVFLCSFLAIAELSFCFTLDIFATFGAKSGAKALGVFEANLSLCLDSALARSKTPQTPVFREINV